MMTRLGEHLKLLLGKLPLKQRLCVIWKHLRSKTQTATCANEGVIQALQAGPSKLALRPASFISRHKVAFGTQLIGPYVSNVVGSGH